MKLFKNIITIILLLILSSCKSSSFTYLNDMEDNIPYPIKETRELNINYGDRIGITVTCKEPDLAKVFNYPGGSSDVTSPSQSSHNKAYSKGYKVDAQGFIEFPLLGKIKVVDMTLPEISDLIKNKIIEEGYIKQPMVTADILNFKYIVLGATGPNVYQSEDGDVSILEAIAKAGDVREIGRVKNIAVIREENGSRTITHLDLTTKNIFESPCYKLRQNDIVYVEPKYRSATRGERNMRLTTLAISVLTSLSTLLYIFK